MKWGTPAVRPYHVFGRAGSPSPPTSLDGSLEKTSSTALCGSGKSSVGAGRNPVFESMETAEVQPRFLKDFNG